MVIISDGEDRASSYKPEKLIALLKRENCPLFFIGFTGQLNQEGGFARESPLVKARKLIEELTKETGGRAFFVEQGSDLKKLVQGFTKALRSYKEMQLDILTVMYLSGGLKQESLYETGARLVQLREWLSLAVRLLAERDPCRDPIPQILIRCRSRNWSGRVGLVYRLWSALTPTFR